jgi:hypothetical protein
MVSDDKGVAIMAKCDFKWILKAAFLVFLVGPPALAEVKAKAKMNLRKQIIDLENKIEYLNRKQICRLDDDCQAISYGYKECGGARDYLMVSSRNPNYQRLRSVVKEHRALKVEESRLLNMVSACDGVQEPIPRCIEKKCQATFSTTVNYTVVQGLLALKLDSSLRIQKEEDFKKYWTDWMTEHGETRQIPPVDFATQEVLAYRYCYSDGASVYGFHLTRVEDAGEAYVARYSKMKLCPSQMKKPCESDFASMVKTDKAIEVKIHEQPQDCGK